VKQWLLVLAVFLPVMLLVGCAQKDASPAAAGHKDITLSGNYKDGRFTAKSSADENGAIGEIALVIKNGKIMQADYRGIKKDGTIKDKEYGKTSGKIENQEFYNKAQLAVKAAATYGPKLIETQDVDKIDAVSGATVSYNQFAEAAKKALKQADKNP